MQGVYEELRGLSEIRMDGDTVDVLVNWVDEGNIQTTLPRALEHGILMLPENESILFDRGDDKDEVRFIWFKNEEPYATFEYNVFNKNVDKIGTAVLLEESEEVYKPFFRITSIYEAAMAFIIKYVNRTDAVTVERVGENEEKIIYNLDHRFVSLDKFTVEDTVQGQLFNFINNTANWNTKL